MFYTPGQRSGLNIGGRAGGSGEAWYVVGKDVSANVVYVDQGHDSPWLQSSRLWSEPAHWIAGNAPARRFACTAQVRYRQHDEPCEVQVLDDGGLAVRFARDQRAVTPGQSLVMYDGDTCIGGAVIAATDAPLESRLREGTPSQLRAGHA
jgi:tRNA-specific 2-thiouridylase